MRPQLYEIDIKLGVCYKNLKVTFKFKAEVSFIDKGHLNFTNFSRMLQTFKDELPFIDYHAHIRNSIWPNMAHKVSQSACPDDKTVLAPSPKVQTPSSIIMHYLNANVGFDSRLPKVLNIAKQMSLKSWLLI